MANGAPGLPRKKEQAGMFFGVLQSFLFLGIEIEKHGLALAAVVPYCLRHTISGTRHLGRQGQEPGHRTASAGESSPM
jgi:hypothetical protein